MKEYSFQKKNITVIFTKPNNLRLSMFIDRIQLFKNKNFSFLALSNFITVTGGGLCYVALTWYVLTLNNHISSVIINSLCFWLPSTLFGPFVGNWIDRLPRKKIYGLANFSRALTFIIFATILHYSPHVFWCYTINGINGQPGLHQLIGCRSHFGPRHHQLGLTPLQLCSFRLLLPHNHRRLQRHGHTVST